MIRFFIAASLLTAASVPATATVRPLNWVHHAKKAAPVSTSRVEYHGETAYSAKGRLYFPTSSRPVPSPGIHAKVKAPRVK